MRKVSPKDISPGRALFLAPVMYLLALLLLIPASSWAQTVTGAFTGKVTDPSGAAVAGAKVTATDTQRGTSWSTVTNGDGVYNLPQVPVSTYNVRVENQGFQAAQQSNITLVLNQVVRDLLHGLAPLVDVRDEHLGA